MTWLTDAEQRKLNEWEEAQRKNRNGDGPTTSKIKQEATELLREQGILAKLDAAADIAKKAWDIAQAIDAKQKKIKDALLRSEAARQSTLRTNLE
jgi:hypothetical protein